MEIKVLITGDPIDLGPRLPGRTVAGCKLIWRIVPVLRFEAVPLSQGEFESAISIPPDWLVFCSSRAVQFWNQLCLEKHYELPGATRIATIGQTTRAFAEKEGWEVDFSPESSGSEQFLREFPRHIGRNCRVLIPKAKRGRKLVEETLGQLRHLVFSLPIYESIPNPVPKGEAVDWAVFTSPSSYEVLREELHQWNPSRLAALGSYTADRIRRDGLEAVLVPEGKIERLGDIIWLPS